MKVTFELNGTDLPLLVLNTAPNKETALTISQILVEEKLAACVNIMPNIQSVYRWDEKINIDEEVLLLIKTSDSLITTLFERIKKIHPYEVPELISINIENGSSDYLSWLIAQLRNK